jgi:predicted CoA-binding protein
MSTHENEKVLVFGYSDSIDRYSNMAFRLLKECHHTAVPFNPRVDEVEKLDAEYDTVTLYVNPAVHEKFAPILDKLKFKRIIFNPGTEDSALIKKYQDKGVEVEIACTLVLLRTDQF